MTGSGALPVVFVKVKGLARGRELFSEGARRPEVLGCQRSVIRISHQRRKTLWKDSHQLLMASWGQALSVWQ